jgi:hypothetical protein
MEYDSITDGMIMKSELHKELDEAFARACTEEHLSDTK